MNGENKKLLTLTIFGGTGDLTFRKLLPALYNLQETNKLDKQMNIVIIGRRSYTTKEYGKIACDWIQKFSRLSYQEESIQQFLQRLHYYQMDFTNIDAYQGLQAYYAQLGCKEHLFYFAVAPRFFEVIANGLFHVMPAQQGKVIVEKPFGEDLISAKKLNQYLENFFQKENVYHIDHYLGKEMIRNMQAIRFMNPIFQGVWNHEFIDHVEISALEEVGVENRGGYYDQSGALKDMVQNHLLQILSIVAMEKPNHFFGDDMHEKQLEVLRSLKPIDKSNIKESMVLAQYEGYRDEDKVDPNSHTETYAALKLYIDNERWKDVPFYIRTGKKLGRREMEVVITFKQSEPEVEPNVLIIKIQPTEGVYFRFNIKKPGDSDEVVPASMDFCQSCLDFNRINTPEAYERLLLAAIHSESSWFSQWEQIETSWTFIEQLKQFYDETNQTLATYPQNSDGPIETKVLFPDGQHWNKDTI